MKKVNKILLSLVGVAFLLGGLSSCNSNNTSSSSSKPITSSSSSNSSKNDSTNNPNGTIELSFWHTFGKSIQEELSKQIDSFAKLVKENEGVDVNITASYQGSYDDLESKITKALATADAPNITVAYPDHVANYLESGDADHQFVVNLDDYITNDTYGLGKDLYLGDDLGSDDFVPAFLDEGRHYSQEGTYSFPFMKSTEVMFYNKRYMQQIFNFYEQDTGSSIGDYEEYLNNLNWDEFMDLCQIIKNHESDFATGRFYPAVYDSDSNMFISQLIQSGNSFLSLDSNGKGVLDFDSDVAKDMVRDLKEDYDKGLFTTKGTINEYGSNLFTNGQAVFSIGSSGGASYNLPTGYSFEVGICKVPPRCSKDKVSEAEYVSQGPTLAVLNNLQESDSQKALEALYSWKFIKYITSTQVNISFTDVSGGYIPVRQSCYEDEYYKEYLEDTTEVLSLSASLVVNQISGHYFNNPVFKGSSKARDEVGGILAQVFLNSKTIDAAFDSAVNQIKVNM